MFKELWILIGLSTVRCDKIEVTVSQGKLLGNRESTIFETKTYFAFYGVPYAQRPTGKLRFKDPQPPEKWKTSFDARVEYHGACAQPHIVHKHRLYGVEDCLRLNVYTPQIPRTADAKLKPIVVWIHGYTFTSSLSHIYGADFLIENDVLLVSVSHRVGVFGFLKLNNTDSNANMGLKDIVMALKWIRKNSKEFGGDKRKITLMGNSSAASFISLLLITDAAKLFSKIILQSGSIFAASLFQGDYKVERERLLSEIEKQGLVFKKAKAKDIIIAAQKIYTNKEVQDIQRPLVPFTPIVERNSSTSLLTKKYNDFYKMLKHIKKPIMVGFNTQESIAEVTPFIQNPYYLRLFSKLFKFFVPFSDGCRHNSTSKSYRQVSDIIKKQYFKTSITEKSLDRFLKYTSDITIYPILKFVNVMANFGKIKLFLYKFDYRGSLNAVKATAIGDSKTKVKGVAGGDEICYILRCEPLWQYYSSMDRDKLNRDKVFIKQMAHLWANFAKYGNPTPLHYVGNFTWHPKTDVNNNILLIRQTMQMINCEESKQIFKFWNDLYEQYYKVGNCNREHDEL